MSTVWVAGVDGCPGGWICVLRRLAGPNHDHRHIVCNRLEDVLALPDAPVVVAVDIPIGLPERIGSGGRGCDTAARGVLGGRQSSVFAVPARAAVMETDYRRACDVAAACSDPPRMVSKQCFFLFAKIREADDLICSGYGARLRECHPEVAFWAMNGEVALSEPKKVKSQPHEPGLAERRRLLERVGFTPEFLREVPWPRRIAAPDDLLDACAAAWSAERIYRGIALSFPPSPLRDDRGIPMCIHA